MAKVKIIKNIINWHMNSRPRKRGLYLVIIENKFQRWVSECAYYGKNDFIIYTSMDHQLRDGERVVGWARITQFG